MTDNELLTELRRLGGTPDAVLRDDGLRRYFLPALRADFHVLATYRYRPRLPLECPLTALGGRSDPELSAGDLEGWKAETRADFRRRWLEGGHFLSTAEQQLVVEEMCVTVREVRSLRLD